MAIWDYTTDTYVTSGITLLIHICSIYLIFIDDEPKTFMIMRSLLKQDKDDDDEGGRAMKTFHNKTVHYSLSSNHHHYYTKTNAKTKTMTNTQ